MFGAPFSVKTAKDGETVTNDFLQINGYAKHASFVKINGRNITIDKNGNFSDGALLSPGYNIVEVKMADRFGKEKRKIYHLVANPPSSVATSLDKNYKLENN